MFKSAGTSLESAGVWKILARISAISFLASHNDFGYITSKPDDLEIEIEIENIESESGKRLVK